MKVIYVKCGVKNYMKEDYSSYHCSYRRSYRRNFRIPYKPEIFQAFFSKLQKLRHFITAMNYFYIKKMSRKQTCELKNNCEIVGFSSSSNLQVMISRVSISV